MGKLLVDVAPHSPNSLIKCGISFLTLARKTEDSDQIQNLISFQLQCTSLHLCRYQALTLTFLTSPSLVSDGHQALSCCCSLKKDLARDLLVTCVLRQCCRHKRLAACRDGVRHWGVGDVGPDGESNLAVGSRKVGVGLSWSGGRSAIKGCCLC